jgi:hypothetical protein
MILLILNSSSGEFNSKLENQAAPHQKMYNDFNCDGNLHASIRAEWQARLARGLSERHGYLFTNHKRSTMRLGWPPFLKTCAEHLKVRHRVLSQFTNSLL